jgi:hypothetical protein
MEILTYIACGTTVLFLVLWMIALRKIGSIVEFAKADIGLRNRKLKIAAGLIERGYLIPHPDLEKKKVSILATRMGWKFTDTLSPFPKGEIDDESPFEF